ncbi:hypothetical protein [Paenibacillus sp. Z6-24]
MNQRLLVIKEDLAISRQNISNGSLPRSAAPPMYWNTNWEFAIVSVIFAAIGVGFAYMAIRNIEYKDVV